MNFSNYKYVLLIIYNKILGNVTAVSQHLRDTLHGRKHASCTVMNLKYV